MKKDLDLKNLNIVPFKSVGPILFNLSVEEVLEMLGEPNVRFKPGFAVRDTFAYDEIGIYISFDKNFKSNTMALYPPANVIMFDKQLYNLSFDDLIKLFNEKELDVTEEEMIGFKSKQVGIAIYAPDTEDNYRDSPVQEILVYRDLDYYQQED